jgi:hypothetical protein
MDFAEATRREDQQEPRDVRPCPASRVSMQPLRPKNRSLATASRSTREFPTTPMQHHCVCGRPARSHPHWFCGTLPSLWPTKPPQNVESGALLSPLYSRPSLIATPQNPEPRTQYPGTTTWPSSPSQNAPGVLIICLIVAFACWRQHRTPHLTTNKTYKPLKASDLLLHLEHPPNNIFVRSSSSGITPRTYSQRLISNYTPSQV